MSCEHDVSKGIARQIPSLPRWLLPQKRPAFIRFGVAIGLVLLSTLLRFSLEPYLGKLVFITYFPAVMIAGWYGGFGPGLVATVLSAAVVDYFWMGPGRGFALGPTGLAQLSFFVMCGVMVSGLNGFLHLALHREREVKELCEVTLSSIGDAVIATDYVGNVTFLNPVASSLTGWSLPEAKGQPLTRVFNIVNEETRQPALNPVGKVLQDKKVCGLANHTVLVSKDGKEIPIQDSAAPIQDREGNILGVVLVFCDDSERRKAEEVHSRLAAVVESSDDAIISRSLDGTIKTWNKGAERIFGYTAEDIIGQRVSVLIPPDRLDEEPKILERLRNGERIEHFETVRLRKDGTLLDISLTVSPIKDSSGAVIGSSKIARDITEQRKQQVALRRSEANLRDFVENASVGLHWVGPDGIILWANKTELDLLGYQSEEYIGHPVAEFHVDPPVIEDILKRLTAGECLNNYEARLRCKDGSIRHSLINSNVLFENGKFIHTRCFTRDITARKQAEEALRASEERFRRAVQIDTVGVIFFQIGGSITFANDAFLRMSGYSREDQEKGLVRWDTMTPAEWMPQSLKAVAEFTSIGRTTPYEKEYIRKDGSRWWGLFAASRLTAEEGVEFITDVTERKNAEKELGRTRDKAQKELEQHAATLEQTVQERTVKLREHVAQLEEFSYTVSHDLRSPLRTMQGYATAVLEDYGDKIGPEGKSLLQQIANAADRMDRLTRDVLAYSKVAREHVAVQPINLEDIVRDIIDQYPSIKESKAVVSVQSPLLSVLGNDALLTQALSNLLGNAVKFVAAGTRPEILIWNEKKGDKVRLWIKDNGIGISLENHARLFGMFERIHPKGRYEGTGIGLAIVRKAMERIGGTTGVESDGVSGSSFWIEAKAA